MISIFINGSDRTSDIVANSLSITSQLGQRTDNCSFSVFQGSKPTENEDIKIYLSAKVESHSGTTIVLQDSYQLNVNRFFSGQKIFLKLGNSALEKVEVSTYTETTKTILLTASPAVSLSKGDLIGVLVFGGVVSVIKDKNVGSLTNIEYEITGLDYTKIFDKKSVSDSWEDKDSRYIINSFVNSTVNYSHTLDTFNYDDNSAIQTAWTESNDGNNPTIDSSDFLENESSGKLSWTNSGGTANFVNNISTKDVSNLVGVSSGTPTEGILMLWNKAENSSAISSFKARVGSDSSNYAEFDFDYSNDWTYRTVKFTDASITGTPDWTDCKYLEIVISETASSYIKLNGLRILQDGSFTLENVNSTPDFDDFRSPQLKPSAIMNLIAKSWDFTWYIDYEKDIHFKSKEVETAPFEITDSSNNFSALTVSVDSSQLGNRVRVKGGEKTSDNRYAQVFEGDNAIREWLLKNKFSSLEVKTDLNSITHTAETGTTTTNIKITAHGLSTGDHVINRTRSNAVRSITVVDSDNFTVEAVASQTSGDTISFFGSSKTIGVEGLNDEASYDYMSNSNEKSVRASEGTTTLTAGEFIRFEYNERLKIQVEYTDTASANALKALGFGDGVFDLDPITDKNVKDTATALVMAKAKVNQYSNAVITGSLTTDQHGLTAGQLLHIQDTVRNIDDEYIIQVATLRQYGGEFKDYITYQIKFGTTLFGWIEFMQKLLAIQSHLEVNDDEIVETYVDSSETIEIGDSNTVATVGIKKVASSETIEASETNNLTKQSGAWQYEVSSGQAVKTRYDLSEYS